jgi:hypothetical protein
MIGGKCQNVGNEPLHEACVRRVLLRLADPHCKPGRAEI